MRKLFAFLVVLVALVLGVTPLALAVSDVEAITTTAQVTGAVVKFLSEHWRDIGDLCLVILPALVLAVRQRQWALLVTQAGNLAFVAARMADLDNEQRRQWVADQLFDWLPLWARPMFSAKGIAIAIEYGWHQLAKPRLKQ